jgi:hypothetical protein
MIGFMGNDWMERIVVIKLELEEYNKFKAALKDM